MWQKPAKSEKNKEKKREKICRHFEKKKERGKKKTNFEMT